MLEAQMTPSQTWDAFQQSWLLILQVEFMCRQLNCCQRQSLTNLLQSKPHHTFTENLLGKLVTVVILVFKSSG